MPNLYYIEEMEREGQEFVVANSIQEAIDRWKAFVKDRDENSGRSTNIEEPELIKLVQDYVIGV